MKIFSLILTISFVVFLMLGSCKKEKKSHNISVGLTGTYTDSRDNKTYNWVEIGEQVWMSENLAYTGNDIKFITDYYEWVLNSDYDGYCYYENNDSLVDIYGILYQEEAAQIACPDGWHIPTEDEWIELENYLKDNGYSYNGVVGNNGIAKSLATNWGWEISENQGAVGNSDFSYFRNITGFSALPGGHCGKVFSSDKFFDGLGHHGIWWCASDSNSFGASYRRISYGISDIYLGQFSKIMGLSVRCVRD